MQRLSFARGCGPSPWKSRCSFCAVVMGSTCPLSGRVLFHIYTGSNCSPLNTGKKLKPFPAVLFSSCPISPSLHRTAFWKASPTLIVHTFSIAIHPSTPSQLAGDPPTALKLAQLGIRVTSTSPHPMGSSLLLPSVALDTATTLLENMPFLILVSHFPLLSSESCPAFSESFLFHCSSAHPFNGHVLWLQGLDLCTLFLHPPQLERPSAFLHVASRSA